MELGTKRACKNGLEKSEKRDSKRHMKASEIGNIGNISQKNEHGP